MYVHLEAPDEAGHRHEIENKVKAIELIDEKIVGPILKYLKESGEEFSMLLMPDHPTPLAIRTHTSDPVPYILYRSDADAKNTSLSYTEANAKSTGVVVDNGYTLMKRLLGA